MATRRVLKGEHYFRPGELPLVVQSARHTHSIRPHSHDFVELVFFASGSAMHRHAGRAEKLETGDLFVIRPDEVHAYEDPQEVLIYNCLFYPEVLQADLPYLKQVEGFLELVLVEPFFRPEVGLRHRLHLGPKDAETVEALLREIQQELAEREPGFQAVAKGLLVKLLVFASRAYSRRKLPETAKELLGKRSLIYECMAYVEDHHARDISLDELAAQAYLSPDYFARIFRRLVGRTPTEYINTVRLERARQALVRGQQSITEIAYEVGYHDSGYFSRLFRRAYGVSPSAYRRKSDLSQRHPELS